MVWKLENEAVEEWMHLMRGCDSALQVKHFHLLARALPRLCSSMSSDLRGFMRVHFGTRSIASGGHLPADDALQRTLQEEP